MTREEAREVYVERLAICATQPDVSEERAEQIAECEELAALDPSVPCMCGAHP